MVRTVFNEIRSIPFKTQQLGLICGKTIIKLNLNAKSKY